MKQKIVIKVQMNCEKCKVKTMKIAASISGVKSVELMGEISDGKIVVIGDVDSVTLTRCLRKKVGKATIESVEEVKPLEKKETKDVETQPNVPKIEYPYNYPYLYPYNYSYPFNF